MVKLSILVGGKSPSFIYFIAHGIAYVFKDREILGRWMTVGWGG